MAFQIDALHLLVRHLATSRVFSAVQATCHFETLGRSSPGDQIDDRLVVPKRFAAPVRGNEREQPVLDLVPFACSRREVADRDG